MKKNNSFKPFGQWPMGNLNNKERKPRKYKPNCSRWRSL